MRGELQSLLVFPTDWSTSHEFARRAVHLTRRAFKESADLTQVRSEEIIQPKTHPRASAKRKRALRSGRRDRGAPRRYPADSYRSSTLWGCAVTVGGFPRLPLGRPSLACGRHRAEIERLLAEDANGLVSVPGQHDLIPAGTKHRLDDVRDLSVILGHKNAGHGWSSLHDPASTPRGTYRKCAKGVSEISLRGAASCMASAQRHGHHGLAVRHITAPDPATGHTSAMANR
jgi:hypothetical protein